MTERLFGDCFGGLVMRVFQGEGVSQNGVDMGQRKWAGTEMLPAVEKNMYIYIFYFLPNGSREFGPQYLSQLRPMGNLTEVHLLIY